MNLRTRLAEFIAGKTFTPEPVAKHTTKVARILRPETGRRFDPLRSFLDLNDNLDPLLVELAKDDVQIYNDMFRDPTVRAAIQRKLWAVTSQEWSIQPAEPVQSETQMMPNPTGNGPELESPNDLHRLEKEKNKEVADFISWTFKNFDTERQVEAEDRHGEVRRRTVLTPTSLRTGLEDIALCILTGYSIVEFITEPIENGPWKDLMGLAALKGKDPVLYWLELDVFGNITGINFGARQDEPEDRWDVDRYLVGTYMGFYSNPYGNADMQALYATVRSKTLTRKLWAISQERYAMPIPMATAPAEAKQAQRDEMLTILRNLRNDDALVIPEGFDLTFLENSFASGNVDMFRSYLEALDKEIITLIEGAFLHAAEGSMTGAKNMGLVHRDTTSLFAERLSHLVCDVINTQLIPRLVKMNFRGVTSSPRFVFTEPEEVDLIRDSTWINNMVNAGLAVPTAWAYEKFGVPIPKDDEPTLQPAASAGPPMGGGDIMPPAPPFKADDGKEAIRIETVHAEGVPPLKITTKRDKPEPEE